VEVSLNCTTKGATPKVGEAVKEAVTLAGRIVKFEVVLLVPAGLVVARVAQAAPAVVNTCTGFCESLVLPSEKVQAQVVGLLVALPVKAKLTGRRRVAGVAT
jgi:hypothetical protein